MGVGEVGLVARGGVAVGGGGYGGAGGWCELVRIGVLIVRCRKLGAAVQPP